MSQRKPLIRRTFLQERLEILIKRQRNGTATFNELTELDAIVNADPEIRKQIIMESMFMDDADFNEPTDIPEKENTPILENAKRQSFLNRLKALISRIFTLKISTENSDFHLMKRRGLHYYKTIRPKKIFHLMYRLFRSTPLRN